MMTFIKLNILASLFLYCSSGNCQVENFPSIVKFEDCIHHWNLLHENKNYSRYTVSEYMAIADNIVDYQNNDGGWPKNIDWLAKINSDSLKTTLSDRERESTLDNNNTFPQIEYLSEVAFITKIEKYQISAQKGINYILQKQNESGGWRGWDTDAITFNDQIMTGVMTLFFDIDQNKKIYSWLNEDQKSEIKAALDKAISVTLKCQIVVNGEKTAWCQQHDHKTLKPIKARSFELPSITARESCDVLEFLMKIENPDDSIKAAINSGIKWLMKSALKGIRIEKIKLEPDKVINKEYPYDLAVVHDSTAKPIWARFYDIQSNTPFMCRRDGTKVYNLSEVDPERRTGYSWYGYWPEETFKKYSEWLKKNPD